MFLMELRTLLLLLNLKNYWQLRWTFGEDLRENQGKKRSEMSPLERSWRWGIAF
jgi:hypothetical protein